MTFYFTRTIHNRVSYCDNSLYEYEKPYMKTLEALKTEYSWYYGDVFSDNVDTIDYEIVIYRF